MPSPTDALEVLGGIATYAELRRVIPRRAIQAAIQREEITKDRRGRYVLATTSEHLRLAHEISAVLSHESAALHHGWKVKHPPDTPTLTVRRNRHLSASDRAWSVPSYSDLPADCIRDGVTTPIRTVVDCARSLPFDRALTVADSALRESDVTLGHVRSAATKLQGRGAANARRVAHQAIYVSANPLESVLRALVADLPGYTFVPQLRVRDHGRCATVDLGEENLKVALEAEGYAFHGGREEFRRD